MKRSTGKTRIGLLSSVKQSSVILGPSLEMGVDGSDQLLVVPFFVNKKEKRKKTADLKTV